MNQFHGVVEKSGAGPSVTGSQSLVVGSDVILGSGADSVPLTYNLNLTGDGDLQLRITATQAGAGFETQVMWRALGSV